MPSYWMTDDISIMLTYKLHILTWARKYPHPFGEVQSVYFSTVMTEHCIYSVILQFLSLLQLNYLPRPKIRTFTLEWNIIRMIHKMLIFLFKQWQKKRNNVFHLITKIAQIKTYTPVTDFLWETKNYIIVSYCEN